MTEEASFIPTGSPEGTLDRAIVLVGMMGAGKSAVGRRLAARLHVPFVDSDVEIEAAAGMTVAGFFESYGETAFRDGERRVIARLLDGPPCVLSTGGGAFIDATTRELVTQRGISVWLKADVEVLLARTARRDDRPLLKGNPRERMTTLLQQREAVYAQADITIHSDDRPVDETVERVVKALREFKQRPVSK